MAQNMKLTPIFDTFSYRWSYSDQILSNIASNKQFHEEFHSLLKKSHDWLIESDYSENNYKTYRSEITLFLNWMVAHEVSVTSLDRSQLLQYLSWCQNPPIEMLGTCPKTQFKTNSNTGERIPNEDWRAFVTGKNGVYNLKKSTIKTKFSILSSFFNYLIDNDVISKNPASSLLRTGRFKSIQQETISKESLVESKHLTPKQWAIVLKASKNNSKNKNGQATFYNERNLFLITLLYSCYLRIGEISSFQGRTPTMGQFYHDSEIDSWYFKVEDGKGGKTRYVAVSDELLNYLKRYRTSMDLTPLPSMGDITPLFPRLRSGAKGHLGKQHLASLGTRQLRKLVTDIYKKAAEIAIRNGDTNDANEILRKTPHSLRHTGISHDINYSLRPLTHVKNDAGHSSLDTTSMYEHTTRFERHESAKNKKI